MATSLSVLLALFASPVTTPEGVEELLTRLLGFFSERQLFRAVALVDEGGVSCAVAEASRRTFFQARPRRAASHALVCSRARGVQVAGQGHSKETYTVWPTHFCTCHDHQHSVISKGEQLMCKHQLACLISSAMGTHSTVLMSDTLFASLLEQTC